MPRRLGESERRSSKGGKKYEEENVEKHGSLRVENAKIETL